MNDMKRLQSHLFKVRSGHSRDNIFQNEKRPALIFLKIYNNCKACSCLFNILFLKKQPIKAVREKDSRKVY